MAGLAWCPLAPPHKQMYPPPLKSPTPWNPPPPPPKETPASMCLLVNISYGSLCCLCVTQGIALLSHGFKSLTCMCSVIFSLQRRCMECCVAFSDPSFLLVTMYGATHIHLVLMCGPLSWGLHQMGHSSATFGTCTLVGSLKWIMRVLNSQGQRLWWLHHPSLQIHRMLA